MALLLRGRRHRYNGHHMKKPVIIIAALVALGLVAGAVLYFMPHDRAKQVPSSAAKPNLETNVAVTQRPITQAIEATTGATEVSLGKVDTDGASISVPKDSFASSTKINLVTPEKIPIYDTNVSDMLGAPIEIAAGDKPVRLDNGATLTFKIPAGQVTTSTDAARLRVAYYNGQAWDYIKPDSVDIAKGTMTFTLYHFSLLAPTKLKGDEKITNDWIKAKVLQDGLNKNIVKPHDIYSAQALDLSMEKLGINDVESKNKALSSMLNDPEYKEMQGYYKTNDQMFDDKLKVLIGKKIAGQVPMPILKNALKAMKVTGATSAASKALGNIVEGNYKDGAKEIGDFLTNQFVLGVAAKAAVAITNYEIRTWKNSEIEAAFKAYRDGSSGYFYGYNNDAKDFDAVWDQMRGIRRQIELEAIRQANATRVESGMEPMTEEQAEAMRNRLKEEFRSQFATRLERENELAEQEKKMIKILDGLKAAGIFDSTTGPAGLDKGFDTETKLDVVGHFIDKMMEDTKRFDLTDKTGLIADKAISVDDLVQGARIYFSGPNGKQDYAKFLKDRFNITLFPTLKELEGNWDNGEMTITDVILSDEAKKMAEEAKNGKKSEDGCDFAMDFNALKGKKSPMKFSIKPTGENSGTLVLNDGKKTTEIPIKYDQGNITGSYAAEGATINFGWNASKQDKGFSIGGGMDIDYKGLIKIKSSVTASK
jgi:hypothetical protein